MTYVFDIDGTISFDGISIDDKIIVALEKLVESNNRVIFASARPIRDMVNIIPKQFKDFIWIGGNGAFIKENNYIESINFDKECEDRIYNLLSDDNIEYLLDSDWDFTYNASLDHPLYKNINKDIANNIHYKNHKKISKLIIFNYKQSHLDYFKDLNVEITYHKNEDLIDISPGKCSKYEALVKLGIKDYIAFGNDANDISMFNHAKKSFCVDNLEYSKFADYLISASEVAKVILSLIE